MLAKGLTMQPEPAEPLSFASCSTPFNGDSRQEIEGSQLI
jgi:hypothetical protein